MGLIFFPNQRRMVASGFLMLVNVCGDLTSFYIRCREDNFLGKATHDATRLMFLCMSLNVHTMSLDVMNRVTSVLPMHRENIPALSARFSLVIVKEESLGFHSRIIVWVG